MTAICFTCIKCCIGANARPATLRRRAQRAYGAASGSPMNTPCAGQATLFQ